MKMKKHVRTLRKAYKDNTPGAFELSWKKKRKIIKEWIKSIRIKA